MKLMQCDQIEAISLNSVMQSIHGRRDAGHEDCDGEDAGDDNS